MWSKRTCLLLALLAGATLLNGCYISLAQRGIKASPPERPNTTNPGFVHIMRPGDAGSEADVLVVIDDHEATRLPRYSQTVLFARSQKSLPDSDDRSSGRKRGLGTRSACSVPKRGRTPVLHNQARLAGHGTVHRESILRGVPLL